MSFEGVMHIYWNKDLGITRNEEDMESMCCDAQGRPVVWPEDMGWEKISVKVLNNPLREEMTTQQVEAEWAKQDAITAMFDAAYEAHGKIDPEYAG